jgi:GAF domain-containing protein
MKNQNLNTIQEYNNIEKLSRLNEIAKQINSVTALDQVLEVILQQGVKLLDVSYGDLWLVEKQTGDLLLLHSILQNKLFKKTKRIKKCKGVWKSSASSKLIACFQLKLK